MTRLQKFRHESAEAYLTMWGDGLATLSNLYAKEPQRGHSRALMGIITAFADERDLEVVLLVRRFGNTRGMSNEQLVEFYKKFGFTSEGIVDGRVFMRRLVGASQDLHVP
jgi:ribosomal protein S18 acetylase RimI-like enzyme